MTPKTQIVDVDPYDITLAQFQAVQRARQSPAVDAATAGYTAIAANRVSIAAMLAIFDHESTMATDPNAIVVKYATNNEGNCRSLRPGSGAHGVVIDTPRGQFVKYVDWVSGWKDLSYRLIDPDYVYVQEGLKTIEQIIHRFAPASDNNDPEGYVNAVVADMNRWIEVSVAKPVPKPVMTIRHSPRFDGYSHPREYLAIVDHIATGTKASNLSWLAGGSAAAAQPSCNYYVAKDGTIYEIVPFEHAPWTNGWDTSANILTKYRPNLANPVVAYWYRNRINPNTGSITTEHEGEASDRLTKAQMESDGHLKAWLHQETGVPLDADHWFGHNFIDGINRPYCPSFDPDEWAQMREQALSHLTGGAAPPVVTVPKPPANQLILPGQPDDIAFTGGFRDYLLTLGKARNPRDPALGALSIFGYALSREYVAEDGNTYQPTQRFCLQYTPGLLPPWDVSGIFRSATPPPPAKSGI